MIGILMVLPENPENEYFHVYTGLKKSIEIIKFPLKHQAVYKLSILIDCLIYLCWQL